jgi:hypothetical protein
MNREDVHTQCTSISAVLIRVLAKSSSCNCVWLSPDSVKGKKVMSLCLTKYHAMKMYPALNEAPCYEDRLGKRDTFLALALDGGEWSTSHNGCFTPGERIPSTHWIGG